MTRKSSKKSKLQLEWGKIVIPPIITVIGAVITTVLGCIGTIVVAQLSINWQTTPYSVPTGVTEASTSPLPTVTSTLTPVVMAFDSPTITITPTVTVFLSETPSAIPSATPVQYIPATRPVELRSGVFMLLSKISVHDRYGRCYYTKSGFSVNFEITNESGSDFLIRFNPYDFSVVDDTDREYTLRASGVDECDPSPAPRIYTLPTGRHISILVNFQEDFGIEASYLIVTVNEISNAGPFVFRKDF